MNLALREAWKYQGLTYPNPAVGCTIVGENGELLAVEAHKRAGLPHAEVEALKSAYFKLTNDESILALNASNDIHNFLLENHNNIFNSAVVYTTLEPCSHVGKTPSCASLLSKLNVVKVYVGSIDFNTDASGGNEVLTASNIKVENNILTNECDLLLEPFKKFQTDGFVFFKWAQRLNGTVDDGIITSKDSRELVHQMRDVCDLMVVGGDTVRVDRPTLDARLANGKAPDILIYSRQEEFDKAIPLFNVEGRKVIISDDLNLIKNYKNVMIEGGAKMYALTRDITDMYLTFIAPKLGGRVGMQNIEDEFEILNIHQETQDIIMWMKSTTKKDI